ncbi:MAG: UDP-3-O-(3-hydroxymyristoyl)glucosamine N-acyltransferase [Deltaproteobacteria bacterium]|nr:UDP-3-O-(3-hydroxymyristoyl)glucosamine N-acyltransferase [Deltaproteobacteria bacterium]
MKVEEIARLLGGKPQGDRTREVHGIAGLESAGAGDISFAEGGRALARAIRSAAGCILIPTGASVPDRTTIAVSHPKLALIRAAAVLLPPARVEPGVHPTAVVSPSARLSPGVAVGAHAVIEDEVTVGAGTFLGAGVSLSRGATIGSDCILHARVAVYPGARVGNRVVIHSGAVIGSDGFGYVFADGRHHKFPQLGQVIIEDDVEIGSNTAIDRGSLGNTVIGQGTKIDNLVQIAHNVRIGRHCVIAAQSGISGSVEIGDYVVMGGQVGVGDRARIEDQAVIGAQAGVPTGKVIRRGSAVWGTPARPMPEFKKTYAQLTNLPNLAKKVHELSRLVLTQSKNG